MSKVLLVFASLVALAYGQIGPIGPHPEAYHYRPFVYEWAVRAPEYGNDYSKTEAQNEQGVVEGEYRTLLPDGRVQIVTYHANPVEGYIADVKYEGDAILGPGPRVGPVGGVGPIGPIGGPGLVRGPARVGGLGPGANVGGLGGLNTAVIGGPGPIGPIGVGLPGPGRTGVPGNRGPPGVGIGPAGPGPVLGRRVSLSPGPF